ncbi:MAG: response regulator [Anaerolineae bacterium]|nr:response regulator [Phycisphaerae bacterium]
MKRANEKRVTIAFWLVLTALAIARLVFYSVTTGYIDNSRRVEQARQVLQELNATLSGLQDVETGQRGYVITGDERYLEPYRVAIDLVPQRLATLRALVADDPEQLLRHAEADRLANAKMAEVTEVITRYRDGGFSAAQARVRDGTGRRLMDQFRAVITQMDAAENTRLNNFATATATDHRRGVLMFGMFTVLDFAVVTIAFLIIHRFAAARDRAEEELRRTSAFQKLILDGAGNAIITGDEKGVINIFNRTAERWLGWRAEEVIGKPDWPWIDPKEIQQRLEELSRERGEPVTDPLLAFTAKIRGDREDVKEWNFFTRSGERIPMRVSVTELRDADGKVTGYCGIAADISEQRRVQQAMQDAKDAAEQANRAKSLFLANMSHELRTPLNAIIGYSEMLAEDAKADGQAQLVDDLKKITQAGKHLLSLINDILDLSKVEAGKMRLHLESFSVPLMIEDVVSTIGPMVRQNSNALKVDVPEDVGSITADLTKLRQVLFNLLSNASKFTSGGEVTLSARRFEHGGQRGGAEEIHFIVRDTGIGMNSTQLDGLFQAFSQAEPSTASRYGGTGLGLAISRQFCRMMGGDIEVRSEVGHGATFTVRLPAHVEDRSAEVNAGARNLGPGASEDKSRIVSAAASTAGVVLVIDDDPAARELLRRYLEADGFRVVTTTSGAEGLALARTIDPVAITLDVMMPETDGWAILSGLKADEALRDIPVIMLSIVDDKSMGFALGAAAFMTKPIDRVELLRVLNKYRDSHAKTILIVEDDSASADLIGRTLVEDGWDVRLAENGRVALELLAQREPALILLDLMMPLMDGFEFAAELRRHAPWREIPVIVLTSKELTDEDRRRLNGDVQKIVQKDGMSREQILREVHTVIDQKLEAEAGK